MSATRSKELAVLGLVNGASNEQIKDAYRKLAMQHHPDRNGDANEFARVTKAYKSLIKLCEMCKGTRIYPKRTGAIVKRVPCPACTNRS